ncbi:MAG: arginine--tRNA ligase, partial [Candidatus Micrarchaeia archaeon]
WKLGIINNGLKFKKYLKQKNGKDLYTSYFYEEEKKKRKRKKEERTFGNGNLVINVIGSEQAYLQKLIKYIVEKIDEEKGKNMIHLSYEHVILPTEKFVGRLGTWIGYTADELLEEGIKRAKVEVEKRKEKSKLKGKEVDKISKMIAISAIKFSMLRVSPTKQVVFDFDRAISFDGDTGPYVQYSCVRAKKILQKLEEIEIEEKKKKEKGKREMKEEMKEERKEEMKEEEKEEEITLTEEERNLIKKISEFPTVIERVSKNYEYHEIANYAIKLSDLFNLFYEKCPVIKAEEKVRDYRKKIVLSVYNVLKNSLGLLGIEIPEKM